MDAPRHWKALIRQFLPHNWLNRFQHFRTTSRESIALEHHQADWTLLRQLLPVGSHVVDVGAGLGRTTRALAEIVGPTGRITSIEPIPMLHDRLRANMNKLRLEQVETLPWAISSRAGIGKLILPHVDPIDDALFDGRHGQRVEEHETSMEVPMRTLDQLFATYHPTVEMIHLDVQGHALHALRGAAELLRRVKPAWWLRIDGRPDLELSPLPEIFRLFRLRGYGIYWFGEQKLNRWPQDDGECAEYALMLTERHLRRLPTAWLPAELGVKARAA